MRRYSSSRTLVRGVTLVEMLVAMAVTLLLMATVVSVFDLLGTSVAHSRATLEMSDRLRHARNVVQTDLASITCPVRPWIRPEEGVGYFEYVEGDTRDKDCFGSSGGPTPTTVVVDDLDSGFSMTGSFVRAPATGEVPAYAGTMVYDTGGSATATFRPNISAGAEYRIELYWISFTNRATNVTLTINHSSGTETRTFSQRSDGLAANWNDMGTYHFTAGTSGSVVISSSGANGVVIADAARFVPVSSGDEGSDGGDRRFGDYDDVLAFTARSNGQPFQGRIDQGAGPQPTSNATIIESPVAEIVYFALEDGFVSGNATDDIPPQMRTLYRRVLLVAPWASELITASDLQVVPETAVQDLHDFQQRHDLSARLNADGTRIILNTLSDLTKRESRFRHDSSTFPHQMMPIAPLTGARKGEDIVLRNVLAFDVRAYDPTAELYSTGDIVVGPCDASYPGSVLVGTGAYVDLGYDGPNPSDFSGVGIGHVDLVRTYDTWSFHYEHDGVDQHNDGETDLSTTGFDDNESGGVDDAGERETSPPYLAPLQGVQVRLRVYETDSRQIKEVSLNQHFH